MSFGQKGAAPMGTRCAPPVGKFHGTSMISDIVAIFYPFSQFCEINIFLLSLQQQPNTAPNLFQRGVEHGKYANAGRRDEAPRAARAAGAPVAAGRQPGPA